MGESRQDTMRFPSFPHERFWGIFIAGFLLTFIIFLSGVWTVVSSLDVLAPGISIDGIDLGGKKFEQAKAILSEKIQTPPSIPIELTVDDKVFATPSAELGMRYDMDTALAEAVAVGRGQHGFDNVVEVIDTSLVGKKISYVTMFDENAVRRWVNEISEKLDAKGVAPTVELGTTGLPATLVVKPGSLDRSVDRDQLVAEIMSRHTSPIQRIPIPVKDVPPLSEAEQQSVRQRAQMFVGKSLTFSVDDQLYTLNDKKLITFLALPTGYKTDEITKEVDTWKQKVTRDPQEPNIVVDGNKVTAFTPPLYGRTIDVGATTQAVQEHLHNLEGLGALAQTDVTAVGTQENPVDVPITRVEPQKKLSDLNSLGISERIGFAESYFHHSIPGRVHNVALTAKRINLTVIPANSVFSFNAALGEVSQATGFQQAYVIQAGRTVLGDGGGVCQDSTTVFRAALNAGLPITQRRGHSYRVGYYEENSLPGVDATVSAPSVDLKFTNDTPAAILVTTTVDTANYHMIVELWGTSDGRKSEISEQKVWDRVPAKPTVYQEDPSLPVGTTKQVDFSAPGAKASFRYIVTRADQTLIDQTFTTVYQPWAAVYLVGTGGK